MNEMNCKHNELAKRIQVKKEGPNKGRFFYACAKPQEEQCDFFEWEQREKEPGELKSELKKLQLQIEELSKDIQELPQIISTIVVDELTRKEDLSKIPF